MRERERERESARWVRVRRLSSVDPNRGRHQRVPLKRGGSSLIARFRRAREPNLRVSESLGEAVRRLGFPRGGSRNLVRPERRRGRTRSRELPRAAPSLLRFRQLPSSWAGSLLLVPAPCSLLLAPCSLLIAHRSARRERRICALANNGGKRAPVNPRQLDELAESELSDSISVCRQ
jgi:hypothetical protein